jgi:hypothetical protein
MKSHNTVVWNKDITDGKKGKKKANNKKDLPVLAEHT